jgi:hypothetical protein
MDALTSASEQITEQYQNSQSPPRAPNRARRREVLHRFSSVVFSSFFRFAECRAGFYGRFSAFRALRRGVPSRGDAGENGVERLI